MFSLSFGMKLCCGDSINDSAGLRGVSGSVHGSMSGLCFLKVFFLGDLVGLLLPISPNALDSVELLCPLLGDLDLASDCFLGDEDLLGLMKFLRIVADLLRPWPLVGDAGGRSMACCCVGKDAANNDTSDSSVK